jgi:3-phosphoshikimate 1-carboxyvinyltransferase
MSNNPSVYPETLEIAPIQNPPHADVRVPGSKSMTNRALILAALSDPMTGSTLVGALDSEDTQVMIDGLRELGFRVQTDWARAMVHVRRGPYAQPIPASTADLFVGNSGTTMRFLTALVSLGHGRYRLDGVARMRERPIEDLLAALRQLGVKAYSERDNGYPPVVVEANGLKGGTARIRGDVSSQFLSALLMAAPLASGDVSLEIEGSLVSEPYVAMTAALMREFGVEVDTERASFHVPGNQCYRSQDLAIEPDASAAGNFFAAAAITQGDVRVLGLSGNSLQGDVRFVNILQEMGCHVVRSQTGIWLKGGPLHGVTVDMNDISDCVMTLAAVALFAEGPTTIRNVAHIRHKETDRLAALAAELRRLGAEADEFADGLTITPRPLHGAVVQTYNDHRMAMSLALVGLRVPGVVIHHPACVAKTYPNFFADLERLRTCSADRLPS